MIKDRLIQRIEGLEKQDPIYRDFRVGDVRHSQANIDKAQTLLDSQPKYMISERMDEAMDWYVSSLARDPEFYRKISSDPRVIFVDYKYKSEELISHSQCVSVVSGTPGWEAICNGKPVALFGYPWYRECPGIFQVTSIEKLKQYLVDINKGEVLVDIDKVSTYSAWVKNISGHKGSINNDILSSLEYDENSKCISDAFIDMINN